MIELSSELLRSRKFLILVLDTLASIILYLGSKYVGESPFADIKFLIGTLQATVLMLIYAISRENAAQIYWMAQFRPRGLPQTPRDLGGASGSDGDVPCTDALRPRGAGE